MNIYKWSAINNAFFPASLLNGYILAGWELDDIIDIEDAVALEFMGEPPEGKIRAVGDNGLPTWSDKTPPSNEVLLSNELSKLGIDYKLDIYDLNASYLAAIVSDGPSEVTKKQIVRDQIAQRKAKYIADIASAREKYPTEG